MHVHQPRRAAPPSLSRLLSYLPIHPKICFFGCHMFLLFICITYRTIPLPTLQPMCMACTVVDHDTHKYACIEQAGRGGTYGQDPDAAGRRAHPRYQHQASLLAIDKVRGRVAVVQRMHVGGADGESRAASHRCRRTLMRARARRSPTCVPTVCDLKRKHLDALPGGRPPEIPRPPGQLARAGASEPIPVDCRCVLSFWPDRRERICALPLTACPCDGMHCFPIHS